MCLSIVRLTRVIEFDKEYLAKWLLKRESETQRIGDNKVRPWALCLLYRAEGELWRIYTLSTTVERKRVTCSEGLTTSLRVQPSRPSTPSTCNCLQTVSLTTFDKIH